MTYQEITPYLNKIVQVNLKNRKRKVGWLIFDHYHEVSEGPLKEVLCVKVRFGEKHIQLNNRSNVKVLNQKAITFKIEDITDIRACI